MGLFKKPNRKFRQRESRNDSDDEGVSAENEENKDKQKQECKIPGLDGEIGNVPSSSSTSKEGDDKSETAVPKASKLLSFHDEEDDGEVFKLKKSNYSRRLAKQRERERKKKEVSSIKETVEKKGREVENSEPKLKIENKPKDKESWHILAGNDAEDMEVDSDGEKEKNNPFKSVLQSGVIPDAATIYAMKKHRQMAREMGDFIPVEEPEKEEEGKSRLIREDDNDRSDDEDDDEPSRMRFTVNTGVVERQKIRETFLSLQEDSVTELETEEAAELDRWEQEQIRKGVGVTQVGPQNSQISEEQLYNYSTAAIVPPLNIDSNFKDASGSIIPPFLNDKILKKSENNLTTGDIKARLEERLSALKKMHEAHKEELAECEKQLIENKELVSKLEIEGPERAQNFSLYQQMSGYVKDLVECLDLKVAHIELLEGKMMDLYKARALKLITRRQLDIRDQSDEFSTLSSEILKGVSAEFLSEKTTCTDEAKLRRAAEREGRRMRRRKQREKLAIILKHQDGMSSDDEEPDLDIVKFKETRANIIDEANTIFEDVVEEFGTLEGVMSNFEKWKYARTDTYTEAFVPLCLPKIFGVFVKLALLRWNPLEEEIDFEAKHWYRQIACYGYNSDVILEESSEHNGCDNNAIIEESRDPDINILPAVIEKTVVSKITGFIQSVWDPLSSKQTTKLINLLQSLHEVYPSVNGKSKQLQTCLKAITTRITKSLDDDIFIPLYPKELLENRSLGAADFFQRQFWSSVKLLQNILSMDELIAENPLQNLALASLLNRYLLMGLHTSIMMKDTLEKCKAIVASFPKSWFTNAKGTTTLPLLKQFSAFLIKFADAHYSQCMKKGIAEEEAKDTIKDIVQLLVSIESLEDAVSIAKNILLAHLKVNVYIKFLSNLFKICTYK